MVDSVRDEIEYMEHSPINFGGAMNTVELNFNAQCLLDPPGGGIDTWEAAVWAMQVHSAVFESATASGESVECRIGEKVRRLPVSGPSSAASAAGWVSAFWYAVICREQERMTRLCEVPIELLRESERIGEFEIDEYAYHWVDALQRYWLRRPGFVETLTEAIDLSHPDVATVADPEALNKLLYQPINLFYRFVTHNVDGFNDALVDALEAHKSYWTADEDRAKSTSGNVPIGVLAVACLAYDGEIPIRVRSDYLPIKLLDRAWVGEFPTV
ncbi:immunity 49 family protein [Streptomyces sp. NBC_00669]|uniref:immunity 49 family protein n=1 Tax=Streptomyces sp. NBC_00669 TaxID=2976011 RepID=UPI002E341F9C|nr:immunity 49 family protein [Streptomyces sp. NBC_00669]